MKRGGGYFPVAAHLSPEHARMRDMYVVSITRLHLKSWRHFPAFGWYAFASMRQVQRARGFVGGWLGGEGAFGNWTATVWEDEASMRAFRNSGPHMRAMPRLLHWCDEAAFAHWEQEDSAAPTREVAYERMMRAGKVSKVSAPSARHAAGRAAGDAAPQVVRRLAPHGT